jgi:hypothetical protein
MGNYSYFNSYNDARTLLSFVLCSQT